MFGSSKKRVDVTSNKFFQMSSMNRKLQMNICLSKNISPSLSKVHIRAGYMKQKIQAKQQI